MNKTPDGDTEGEKQNSKKTVGEPTEDGKHRSG